MYANSNGTSDCKIQFSCSSYKFPIHQNTHLCYLTHCREPHVLAATKCILKDKLGPLNTHTYHRRPFKTKRSVIILLRFCSIAILCFKKQKDQLLGLFNVLDIIFLIKSLHLLSHQLIPNASFSLQNKTSRKRKV